MKQSFDQILSAKIKQSFENYEAPYNQAHWKALEARLKAQKRPKTIVPFWAKAAASIAFLAAIAIIFALRQNNIPGYARKIQPFPAEKQEIHSEKQFIFQKKTNEKQEKPSENSHHPFFVTQNNNKNPSKLQTKPEKNNFKTKNTRQTPEFFVKSIQPLPRYAGQLANLPNEPLTIRPATDSARLQQMQLNEQLASQQKEKNKDKRFRIGLELAGHYDYSGQQIASSPAFGGGVVSGVRLSKRLHLSSGVVVLQQSIDIQPSNKNLMYAPALNGAYASQSIENRSIDLIGLDIPLNLRYQISAQNKTRFFIIAGVSSLAYLGGNYSETSQQIQWAAVYNPMTDRIENNAALAETTSQTNQDALQNFYFARLVNFGFAINYSLGKGEIVVEPFFKYPLGKTTSENIKLGYAGVALRYNFGK